MYLEEKKLQMFINSISILYYYAKGPPYFIYFFRIVKNINNGKMESYSPKRLI